VALTMTWIGLIGGVVIGGLIWELEGALVLGFLGWLAGMIIKSNRAAAQSVVQTSTPGPGTGQVQVPVLGVAVDRSRWPMEQRVARLEEMVARLEAQLAAGTVAAPAARATPEPPPIPETAAAPAEVAVPAPAPEPEPAFVAEPAPAPTPAPELALPPIPPTTPNPIVAWLTGGNTIARVGLLILFIGFAFLLKYAADQKLFPPELRIAAVAAGGIALLFLGWRLRFRNEGYALGLQGAGVAVLYLTTFGALRLYHLIPPELAFFLLAGIAVFSAILAVRQDAVALAVIGAGGGFLAPILASTGGGSHVMLFSYYLVLNLGILAIAWFRSWRALNLTGFAFTFVIFWVWGERSYQPEHFATTEPFLIAFFLVYVALAVLVAREKPGSDSNYGFRRYVDGTLVFGVPLAAFALQAELTNGIEYGLAISALVTAAFYVALTWGLLRTQRESWKLLAQSFVALAVVFVTLAIPLALDARWTSASWALEGAAIIWIGIRQKRTAARVFGLILQFLAGVAYLAGRKYHGDGIPLVDAPFLGAAIMALAGLWTHRLFLTNARRSPRPRAGSPCPSSRGGSSGRSARAWMRSTPTCRANTRCRSRWATSRSSPRSSASSRTAGNGAPPRGPRARCCPPCGWSPSSGCRKHTPSPTAAGSPGRSRSRRSRGSCAASIRRFAADTPPSCMPGPPCCWPSSARSSSTGPPPRSPPTARRGPREPRPSFPRS
jgi:hypothetical protein